jgi:hypothetical protein
MTTKQKQIDVVWFCRGCSTCCSEMLANFTDHCAYKSSHGDLKFIRASSKKEVLKATRKLGLLTWAYCDDFRTSKHECNLNRDLDGVCFVCGKREKTKRKREKVNEKSLCFTGCKSRVLV